MNSSVILQAAKTLSDMADNPLLDQLDSFCEGSIIVDKDARIRWISEKYRKMLSIPRNSSVTNRPIEEFIPNSMMRQVVTSGKPIMLDLMNVNGTWMVVTRFPIRDRQDRVIGGIGFIFYKELDYLKSFANKFARLTGTSTSAEKQLANLRQAKYDFSDFIGRSQAVTQLVQRARQAADLDTTVLILGETGTGKELLAHAVHQASTRAERPFVCVNMAAVPESLLEAEFFGVAPGAYTGADRKGRMGKIQLANTGTLFLDEVGDLPHSLQSKLLRVLQEQEVEALGSNQVIRVNVRIIAATSRNLAEMVADGSFRADLYYRLNVLPVEVPPLRERKEDLPVLCEKFLTGLSQATGMPQKHLSMQALSVLSHYGWPGNVRELQNTLERAYIFSNSDELKPEDFSQLQDVKPETEITSSDVIRPLSETLATAEKRAIQEALLVYDNNRTVVAKKLGISRATLYEKLRKLGLE